MSENRTATSNGAMHQPDRPSTQADASGTELIGDARGRDNQGEHEIEGAFLALWRALVRTRNAIDVGAHIGDFSSALLDAGMRTWAIEPNPLLYGRLKERLQSRPQFRSLNIACSSKRDILQLQTAATSGSQALDRVAIDGLYGTLQRHPTFRGFEFRGTQTVVAWPLHKLADGGLIPREIGLLKIDTEGHDPQVLRGLGPLRPEIILTEYWNRSFVFNQGRTSNDIPTYNEILEPLGYKWSITFYRCPRTGRVGYTVARDRTPDGTWGNIVFFSTEELLEASLDWIAGVDRVQGFGQGEVMLIGMLNRADMWRRRLKETSRAAAGKIKSIAPATGIAEPEIVARPLFRSNVQLVVSPNEICSAHGTGILLARLLEGQENIVTIRSQTTYGSAQQGKFASELVLPNPQMDRAEIVEQVARWMRAYTIDSITCVPYFETDLLVALALKAISGAPLAIYLMDDNCLYTQQGINRATMAEALATADAVFAISPEFRSTYEREFNRKIWIIPPLVAPRFIRSTPSDVPKGLAAATEAVMIGNIWSQAWLDDLIRVLAASKWKLTWYASNSAPNWLKINKGAARSAGLEIANSPPVEELIERISHAPFVVIPSGVIESDKDTSLGAAIARLSLPSRLPFIVAATGTPILSLGDERTGVASFIRRFEVGETVGYDHRAFDAAAERLITAERQAQIRKRAAEVAGAFDVTGIYDHIVGTAKRRGYIDNHIFEMLFKPLPSDYTVYMESPIPANVHHGFSEIYRSFERLKKSNYTPDFVIDVGASTGIWSYYISDIFPTARFLLIDPIMPLYPSNWLKPGFLVEHAAAGDTAGRATFKVSGDLYNSSLVGISSVAQEAREIDVPIVTLDAVVAKHGIEGRGILKIDVQFAEHLVLAGARNAVRSVDFLVLELTLDPAHPNAKNMVDMLAIVDDLGFRPFDDVGGWRAPDTGFLEQKDLVFVRRDFDLTGLQVRS